MIKPRSYTLALQWSLQLSEIQFKVFPGLPSRPKTLKEQQ